MATILYPNGTQEERYPANGQDFQLKELQQIVGGSIEIIPTRDGRILVANEESKLLDMPRNEQATALVEFPSPEEMRALLAANPHIIFTGEIGETEVDYISGTVLLCEDNEVR